MIADIKEAEITLLECTEDTHRANRMLVLFIEPQK
jgi:hypothetical protein